MKLSKQDRSNITFLALMYDLMYDLMNAGKAIKGGRQSVQMDRDADTLLSLGFKYGFSGQSMFGRDRTGQDWQIGLVQANKNHTGGHFAKTMWYTVDSDGRRQKQKNLSYEQLYDLFGEKR